MKVERLQQYTPEIATRIRELLIQLSRSGKDRGEIPKEWFDELINSPFHDILVAYDENNNIVGIATLSVTMGPITRKNAYLEDFVTDITVRGQGAGSALWDAMLEWCAEKGCGNLCFTCGKGREAAQGFYKAHGAEIYETNFFRRQVE